MLMEVLIIILNECWSEVLLRRVPCNELTESEQTQAHDDLFRCHDSSDDSVHHTVVTDESDEGLGKLGVAGNVNWHTAVKHW